LHGNEQVTPIAMRRKKTSRIRTKEEVGGINAV